MTLARNTQVAIAIELKYRQIRLGRLPQRDAKINLPSRQQLGQRGRLARRHEDLDLGLGDLPQHMRTTTDSFLDADTRDALARTRRKTLLIAGVASEIIVQHSALSGAAQGYTVQVVVDACGGLSARTEEAAFCRLTQAGVVMTSIVSIAGQLARDFREPKAGQAIGILYEMASA